MTADLRRRDDFRRDSGQDSGHADAERNNQKQAVGNFVEGYGAEQENQGSATRHQPTHNTQHRHVATLELRSQLCVVCVRRVAPGAVAMRVALCSLRAF